MFTEALVEGLRTGAADTDHDGEISVDDAYRYVFDQVQAAGAAQTPQRWLYGGEGGILLARNPAARFLARAALPESLRAGLDSPHPNIRIGAVTELGEWLTGPDVARAAAARHHLEQVADTDIPRVASIARALLAPDPPLARPDGAPTEPDRSWRTDLRPARPAAPPPRRGSAIATAPDPDRPHRFGLGVAFSPDGHLLATTSHDKSVRLWS